MSKWIQSNNSIIVFSGDSLVEVLIAQTIEFFILGNNAMQEYFPAAWLFNFEKIVNTKNSVLHKDPQNILKIIVSRFYKAPKHLVDLALWYCSLFSVLHRLRILDFWKFEELKSWMNHKWRSSWTEWGNDITLESGQATVWDFECLFRMFDNVFTPWILQGSNNGYRSLKFKQCR